jgi:hypothetical protein
VISAKDGIDKGGRENDAQHNRCHECALIILIFHCFTSGVGGCALAIGAPTAISRSAILASKSASVWK